MTARRNARPRRGSVVADREAKLALAHALRTPLTSLALGLGLLDGGVLGALNEGQADVVRTLVGEIAELTALVDRELAVGSLGPYTGPAPRVVVDLAELVRKGAAPIERQAVAQGVTLRLEVEGVRVTGDPLKLGWVAVSLMGNALRYSPRGATITVLVGAIGGEAHLEVRDQGPGLEPKAEARLFERDGGAGLFSSRVRSSSNMEVASAPPPRETARLG